MSLTDDPKDPRLGRGVGGEGMNEAYLVLSDEERAKGFVRPVRRSYMHVGRALCGLPFVELFEQRRDEGALPAGTVAYVCCGLPGHDGDCSSWMLVDAGKLEQVRAEGKIGGCGTVTSMAVELAETYARQPDFYGATYCCGCGTHLPVGAYGEFVWCDGGGSGTGGEPIPLWVGT